MPPQNGGVEHGTIVYTHQSKPIPSSEALANASEHNLSLGNKKGLVFFLAIQKQPPEIYLISQSLSSLDVERINCLRNIWQTSGHEVEPKID